LNHPILIETESWLMIFLAIFVSRELTEISWQGQIKYCYVLYTKTGFYCWLQIPVLLVKR
jgi:hypothetical protein